MHGVVRSRLDLTPHLVRLVLGGEGLAGLTMPRTEQGIATDAYVNVAIPPPGAPYDAVFDPARVREEHPEETWPARRRYTVRSWDAARGELAIDFVVHGDEGVAGPWARDAREGDVLVLEGPSGGYRPDNGPETGWHLMVGDESALPAIAASMEAVAPGAPLTVVLLCDGPDHEIPLETDGDLDLRWVHRDGSQTELLDAVAALDFAGPDSPSGVHAFVHGEAEEIRGVRRHLLAERGLTRAQMSCSPYWRRTMTDEAWRRVKRDFVQAMEQDA